MLLSQSIIQGFSLVQESRSANGTSSKQSCYHFRFRSKMSFVDHVCQRYEKYVQSHPEIVTQVESTIRVLSYLIPGIK